jgi:peptidyl-prolyl cis-trans isomerase C
MRPGCAVQVRSGLGLTLGLVLGWSALGCDRPEAEAAKPGSQEEIVARIDGRAITRLDFERHLSQQAPFVQARYRSPERRKELLSNLIRFEVLAMEADKRGYGRDPDVVRYVKQRAIEEMIASELDAVYKAEDVPEAELEPYYRAHPELFTQKEAVRVSQILARDRAEATRLVKQVRALAPRDEKGFRRLVEQHSQDEDSKQRGGDLTFLERDSPEHSRAVIEAAYTLREIGDVSEPVESEKGFHILKLTQRRAGFLRPFEEVKRQVRTRLYQEGRAKKIEEWVQATRERVKIEIFEDKLKDIKSPP